MKYFCNPLNIEYKYQFHPKENGMFANREAADPSLVKFKEMYYLFPSMTAGFLTSTNMADWEFHPFQQEMPIYDYAPDVRVIGEYLYFSASKRNENCSFYRTTDPIHGSFEKIEGTFPFWDPHLFLDDDGRIYFYWGCSNVTPIYGVEVEMDTMKPLGEKIELIGGRDTEIGYERTGDDHVPPKSQEKIEAIVQQMLQMNPNIPEERIPVLYAYMGNAPYIEGPWMTKHQGKYYLQYASPGAEYNTYLDGVYIGETPLGPFTLAKNNPYSYKPGGFITGAGHGSTVDVEKERMWYTSTMRISINHPFERRIGLWMAGFDESGDLYCDQRYGDWPINVEGKPWEKPEWMLLSYKKEVKASSGEGMAHVTDEDIRTWWEAGSNKPDEWIQVDLGKSYCVCGMQINFADYGLKAELPNGAGLKGEEGMERYIDERIHYTRWLLEGSQDGEHFYTIEDKTEADTDFSHDFIVREDGIQVRYLRLTVKEIPFGQVPKVSGLRVFGIANGPLPTPAAKVQVCKHGELDMVVSWEEDLAAGHNILWGYAPEKLYHSYMVFGKNSQKIGALIKDEEVYVRVDAFNETGIIEGKIIKVKDISEN